MTVTIEDGVTEEGRPPSSSLKNSKSLPLSASAYLEDLSLSSRGSSVWDKPMPPPPEAEAEAAAFLLSPMLQRFPSFVPLRRHATSIASVAFLVPSSTSDLRKATVMAATFNMTATIIGGGVLSIPLSCARAGVVPFTALMIISAVVTDFSLYILCSSARRTGSTSYGSVARMAVGPNLELFTTAVIFFLVGFILVGLMVLNQGIWSPIVMAGINAARGENMNQPTTTLQDSVVLALALALMLPYLLKRDLTALRHICFVGFFSIAILCVAMAYRALELNLVTHPGLFQTNVMWTTDSFADVLNALPIILLAFLCSFNIISVHCSLIDPTRGRVREVIHLAVCLSFLIMYVFGLAGYLYAYDETDGNILLNFDPADAVIFLGRVGCGITTLFALPMNLLPCREALISLLAQIGERGERRRRGAGGGGAGGGGSKKPTMAEQRRLLALRADAECESEQQGKQQECGRTQTSDVGSAHGSTHSRGSLSKSQTMPLDGGSSSSEAGAYGSIPSNAGDDAVRPLQLPTTTTQTSKASSTKGGKHQPSSSCGGAEAVHWGTTLGIIAICFVAAVLAPGVAIVWDIAGSSMAFLIQFVIPAVCYIRLKGRVQRHMTKRVANAWALLVFACVGGSLCTAQTVWRLLYK